MNFKKFVASLAVSTMLVGSQVAFSGAMENSPKTEVSQGANSEERGVVKTVLNVIPGVFGTYNSALYFFSWDKIKLPFIGSLKLPCFVGFVGKDGSSSCTHTVDGLCIAYSVSRFLV